MDKDEARVLGPDGRHGPPHTRGRLRERQDALRAALQVSGGRRRAQRRRTTTQRVLPSRQGELGYRIAYRRVLSIEKAMTSTRRTSLVFSQICFRAPRLRQWPPSNLLPWYCATLCFVREYSMAVVGRVVKCRRRLCLCRVRGSRDRPIVVGNISSDSNPYCTRVQGCCSLHDGRWSLGVLVLDGWWYSC